MLQREEEEEEELVEELVATEEQLSELMMSSAMARIVTLFSAVLFFSLRFCEHIFVRSNVNTSVVHVALTCLVKNKIK